MYTREHLKKIERAEALVNEVLAETSPRDHTNLFDNLYILQTHLENTANLIREKLPGGEQDLAAEEEPEEYIDGNSLRERACDDFVGEDHFPDHPDGCMCRDCTGRGF